MKLQVKVLGSSRRATPPGNPEGVALRPLDLFEFLTHSAHAPPRTCESDKLQCRAGVMGFLSDNPRARGQNANHASPTNPVPTANRKQSNSQMLGLETTRNIV
jgi:hypothetical protein